MKHSWQRQRGEFNHDWLKNQYLPALGSWLNLIDNRISDPGFERSFVPKVLPQWEHNSKQAVLIAQNFEREMSPRQLFDRSPLSSCDQTTKIWLGDLIHVLWRWRYGVDSLVNGALMRIEKADAAYRRLQEALHSCSDIQSAEALRAYRPQFEEFRSRCQELAKTIEKFPSEVKVA